MTGGGKMKCPYENELGYCRKVELTSKCVGADNCALIANGGIGTNGIMRDWQSRAEGGEKVSRKNWIWMPHAAHFCGAESCLFFMSTFVKGYIVSTVGEYYPRSNGIKPNKMVEIGLDRFFETMVFKAIKSDCGACPYEIKSGDNKDFNGYKTRKEAFEGHYKMCEKYEKLHEVKP